VRKTSWLARSSHYRRLRLPWDFPTKATWRVTSVRCSALRPDSSGGRSVRIGRGFTAGWCAGSLQSADCHRHASPDLSAGSIGPGGLRGRMSCGRSRCALQETRHQNVVLGDSGPKSRFGRWFPHTETSPYVRNAAISWYFPHLVWSPCLKNNHEVGFWRPVSEGGAPFSFDGCVGSDTGGWDILPYENV
jgi:hypothetical protein